MGIESEKTILFLCNLVGVFLFFAVFGPFA